MYQSIHPITFTIFGTKFTYDTFFKCIAYTPGLESVTDRDKSICILLNAYQRYDDFKSVAKVVSKLESVGYEKAIENFVKKHNKTIANQIKNDPIRYVNDSSCIIAEYARTLI